jgi:hypothetical protein
MRGDDRGQRNDFVNKKLAEGIRRFPMVMVQSVRTLLILN